ncbi:hypothetical protein KRX51_09660 [Corynebacterium sp. TAE3-ERU12]|uniref:hypothetical protein n=1 Tax=Corynebacterium sp. TAE3-ERU12 TaxID=2849491 RepID=UPI001C479D2C|nr:hypothetical protein [Corynebacterium sp. TAE3-ERU12]MBV7296175.1 hypothetical protein [Corynebacterium sp. TAE3-ERU12]
MHKTSHAFALNLVLIALSMIVQFFQNKYFVQYLGIHELGLVRLLTQMLQYLNIIEAALGNRTQPL